MADSRKKRALFTAARLARLGRLTHGVPSPRFNATGGFFCFRSDDYLRLTYNSHHGILVNHVN